MLLCTVLCYLASLRTKVSVWPVSGTASQFHAPPIGTCPRLSRYSTGPQAPSPTSALGPLPPPPPPPSCIHFHPICQPNDVAQPPSKPHTKKPAAPLLAGAPRIAATPLFWDHAALDAHIRDLAHGTAAPVSVTFFPPLTYIPIFSALQPSPSAPWLRPLPWPLALSTV